MPITSTDVMIHLQIMLESGKTVDTISEVDYYLERAYQTLETRGGRQATIEVERRGSEAYCSRLSLPQQLHGAPAAHIRSLRYYHLDQNNNFSCCSRETYTNIEKANNKILSLVIIYSQADNLSKNMQY